MKIIKFKNCFLLCVSFIISGCYTTINRVEAGQYYDEGNGYTHEIRFYKNGTFHNITTVNDVGGFTSIYGTYVNVDSTIIFKDDLQIFFEKHLEIKEESTRTDSLKLTFKEFIPIGCESEFDMTYSVNVHGTKTNGDSTIIYKHYDGKHPASYSNIEINIPKEDLLDVNEIWIESFSIQSSYALSKDLFLNASSIVYPVFHRWEYQVSREPFRHFNKKYWTGKYNGDKYIFEEFKEGFDSRKMKFKRMNSNM